MPTQTKKATTKQGKQPPPEQAAQAAIATLKRLATKHTLDGMARYAIPSDKAFGVSVGDIQKLGKRLGRNHELAVALWKTGWYEARMLAAFVDEPERISPAQMDRWCRDFDNWGICDTVCFKLFDRSPHAFSKVDQWASSPGEFVRRGAFALLASLALHHKQAGDEPFIRRLSLIEAAATDERNFVKKSVSWALRSVGGRNPELKSAAVMLAERLLTSPNAAARWVGRDALKQFTRPASTRQTAARKEATAR